MISQTKLKMRSERKTSPEIVDTLVLTRKNKAWNIIGKGLSGGSRRQRSRNLFEIDAETSAGDTIVILGRILSKGELTKKVRICALGISAKALEKLKDTKSEFVFILDEIKKNPKAEGIKVL